MQRAANRIFLLALILLLAGCAGFNPSRVASSPPSQPFRYHSRLTDADAKAYYYFSLAIMRHNQGDLEGVVTALKQALTLDEHTPALRLYLAEILLQLKRDDEALRALEDVLVEEPDSVPALRLYGEVLVEKKRFEEAILQFHKLRELLPDDEEPVLLMVQALARKGDTIEAIDQLKSFLADHDDSYRAYYALARLYRQIDLTVSAEQAYRKVLTLQPELLPIYLELGKLYEQRGQKGDLEQALKLYRDGLKVRPDAAALRHRLVQVLLTKEDYPQARKELEKLLADNPDDPEALRKYGLLSMEQKRWPDAARSFEHLLSLGGELDTIHYYLGNVYENSAEPYEALREFLQIAQDAELYPDARIHAAYLYRMLDEQDQAVTVLEPLVDDPRLTVDQLLLMTSLAADGGDANRALQLFQKGEQRFPGNTRIIYQRGMLLEKIGMRDASRRAMQEILEIDPEHAEALNFIAYQYAEEGTHLDEALSMAKRALEISQAGHIYDTLGWVLFRLQRYDEALTALQSAMREMPDDAVIQEHVGDVYAALKKPQQAREHYSKSLKLDPENAAVREKLEALP